MTTAASKMMYGLRRWIFGQVEDTEVNRAIRVDDQGRVYVNIASIATGSNVGHDITQIGDGRRVVAAAGTRVTLSTIPTPAKWAIITAETDNTGVITVGGNAVIGALATRRGTPLYAGESITLQCDDLFDIYLDTTVNGDGVSYIYLI